jgi:hypothetical protein
MQASRIQMLVLENPVVRINLYASLRSFRAARISDDDGTRIGAVPIMLKQLPSASQAPGYEVELAMRWWCSDRRRQEKAERETWSYN